MRVSGKDFSEETIGQIREAATREGMTRGRLARMVCGWLNWRHYDGRLKEIGCRVALSKLDRLGVISLPEAKPTNFSATKEIEKIDWPAIKASSVAELKDLEVVLVNGDKSLLRVWRQMMREHHQLGDGPLVGGQVRYLIRCSAGWLAGLSFSASAWRLKDRDEWIGWDDAARERGLSKIVCNSRFLILPTVQVKHLASQILGLVLKRLASDWHRQYGEEPVLVETFVDRSRFKGTSYLAANFTDIGLTQGRGRQDRHGQGKLERKLILVYPLRPDWQTILCEGRKPYSAIVANSRVIDWVDEEFGRCELGDSRLTGRLKIMARDFSAQPMANLPQACGSRAKTKAAYRFMDNEKTSLESILQSHYLATQGRIAKEAVVLAVQDTTSVNYTGLEEADGLGPIGSEVDGAQGLILHDTMAFNLNGTPLGLVKAQCWARDPLEFGRELRKKREKLPIEAKESMKWLTSYRAVADVQARYPNVMLVSMGDREADIYELFDEAVNKNPNGPKLLVRAQHNRRVQNEASHLWELLESQPLAGTQVLQVPRTKNRPKREAHLEVRFAKVTLSVPQDKRRAKGGGELEDIQVWAVLAQEKNGSGKEALEWLLLTTLPVETFEQATEKLVWYTKRWGIEVYHKTIKSGCRIEKRQLFTADRLETCLAIDLVVAWRIYQMAQLGREVPNVSCEVCFDEYEWKALSVYTSKQAPPSEPPTLREAIRMTANLGGFLGRKCDGEPGTETLWRGVQRLCDISGVYEVVSSNPALLAVPPVAGPRLRSFRKGKYG